MDRNYKERPGQKARPKSLSARRAWIEIGMSVASNFKHPVALRKESVDRNNIVSASSRACAVALRKESVDRNVFWTAPSRPLKRSLSARRAWIEIPIPVPLL